MRHWVENMSIHIFMAENVDRRRSSSQWYIHCSGGVQEEMQFHLSVCLGVQCIKSM